MDDQSTLRVDNDQHLLETVTGRPLVTFAVFAYNQESYIRDAVLGAFSQTYTPLEIILSDDGSSDRTFEIMQQMAAEYSGIHKVLCKRTSSNLGIYQHVASSIRAANGELVVLAAGDDISIPERTQELVQLWKSSRAWGLWSKFNLIGAGGELLAQDQTVRGSSEILSWLAPLNRREFVHGATSAYDRKLFSILPDASYRIDAEDGVMNVTMALLDLKVAFCDKPLILYRQHSSAMANTGLLSASSAEQVRANEMRLTKFSNTFVNMATFAASVSKTNQLSQARYKVIEKRVQDAQEFYQLRSQIYSVSIARRVTRLFVKPSFRKLAFIIPRILGLEIFAQIKATMSVVRERFNRV